VIILKVLSQEKREIVKKLQEAVGKSPIRLKILKNINKKESVFELRERLKIPSSTMSETITRFKTYKLIQLINKKDNSEVYDKIPMLKVIGSLDKWITTKIDENEIEIEKKRIKLRVRIPSSIPFIDSKIENDAEKMKEPYVILYLFENSVRKFIDNTLSDKYGKDKWWQIVVTKKDLQNKIIGRKELEGINKWHVPRGASEIFYTDLEDLAYLLNKERKEFSKYLDVDMWILNITKIIKLSRNIVDHHNPLPGREIKRLRMMLEDWKRQLS